MTIWQDRNCPSLHHQRSSALDVPETCRQLSDKPGETQALSGAPRCTCFACEAAHLSDHVRGVTLDGLARAP